MASENMRRQAYDHGRCAIGRYLYEAVKALHGEEYARRLSAEIVAYSKHHPEPNADVVLGLKVEPRLSGEGAH